MRARRKFILSGLVAGTAALATARCGALTPPAPSAKDWGNDEFFGAPEPFNATVEVDWGRALHPANPRLCGTNIQWVDGGDGLLVEGGLDFAPAALDMVKRLAPTVVRYPGGSHSDLFNWRAGMGPLAQRGVSEHFHRKEKQLVRLGTVEFLRLCEALGAEAVITVNAATLAARDAADWVTATNVTRLREPGTMALLPKVPFWEVGNEPYLQENQRPETWIKPADFARRANDFIASMRKADASIGIGIPLRSDKYSGGLPATPYPGYNETVLTNVTERYDFVALHDAYLPFALDRLPSDRELYASMMASVESVRDDLEATRRQLGRFPGRGSLPIALTEYNAFVSIGLRTDAYLAAPAGAIYVADVLCLLASRPDVLMANHWSLIGNWYFGTLGFSAKARPSFEILRMFRDLLRGQVVQTKISTERQFSAPRVGASRAAANLSTVTGIATREGNVGQVLLINKCPNAQARVSIPMAQVPSSPWSLRSWVAGGAFANPDGDRPYALVDGTVNAANGPLALSLSPSSVTVVRGALPPKV